MDRGARRLVGAHPQGPAGWCGKVVQQGDVWQGSSGSLQRAVLAGGAWVAPPHPPHSSPNLYPSTPTHPPTTQQYPGPQDQAPTSLRKMGVDQRGPENETYVKRAREMSVSSER